MGKKHKADPLSAEAVKLEERITKETVVNQILSYALEGEIGPITAAEQAFGVGRNQLDSSTEMSLVLRYNQMKRSRAEWENDTYFGMGWGYFLKVLKEQSFEQVYSHDFQGFDGKIEEFNVWVRKDNGFLVRADSYNEKKEVNSANLCYELSLPGSGEELTEGVYNAIWKLDRLGASRTPIIINGKIAPGLFYNFDAREGLVRKLKKTVTAFLPTNTPWRTVFPNNTIFLRLYDFADAKIKEAETYEENHFIKNKRALDKLPQDIQELLGWK